MIITILVINGQVVKFKPIKVMGMGVNSLKNKETTISKLDVMMKLNYT